MLNEESRHINVTETIKSLIKDKLNINKKIEIKIKMKIKIKKDKLVGGTGHLLVCLPMPIFGLCFYYSLFQNGQSCIVKKLVRENLNNEGQSYNLT